MIVMFRGTNNSKNMAPQVLALYATINAIKYNRKTLVLQFMKQFPVEKILRGALDQETELMDAGRYTFDDSGIDALFRRVDNQKLGKENFELMCRGFLKTENLLDVAGVSKKDDFNDEVLEKETQINQIVQYALDVYDDIYILGDGKRPGQMDILNPIVDISIICIPQGNKEEVEKITSKQSDVPDSKGNDYLFMITDFDNKSSFDVAKMKKLYDVKRIAIMPYTTGFKDAYNSDNVLSFAMNNTDVKETDSNYPLFRAVYDVHKQIMNHEEPEEKPFDIKKLERKKKEEEQEEHDMRTLGASNVRYTKHYDGIGPWKQEQNGYEVTTGQFEDEISAQDAVMQYEDGDKGKYDDYEEYEEYDEFDDYDDTDDDFEDLAFSGADFDAEDEFGDIEFNEDEGYDQGVFDDIDNMTWEGVPKTQQVESEEDRLINNMRNKLENELENIMND